MSEEKYNKHQRPKPVTTRRLWLFRLVTAVVLPALLLLLIELSLRIANYGSSASAIIPCQIKGVEAYCDNAKFGWQFFPKNVSREFNRFVFPADKSDNAYRVFILGASAAQGTPAGEYSFGRILEVMLRDSYPGIDFQIVTAAMPAINSHAALMIAEDCSHHQPDLYIVYLGNNEVVGPYGAGTILTPIRNNLSLIRARIALKATRLGQLLQNVAEAQSRDTDQMIWRGLEMFLDEQVRADSHELTIVRSHFQDNLQDIAAIARKKDIPIIFSSVGSNLKDSPPFASQHRQNLREPEKDTWNNFYQQGISYETDRQYHQAITSYLLAARIDDTYADLHFRLARCYWATQQYDQAREEYIAARELDTLRFRADNSINEIIRRVADRKPSQAIHFLDAVSLFQSHSPHATPGSELFYEHVHLNFSGNYLLAKAMLQKIQTLLPETIRLRKNAASPLLSEEQCAQHLAYTSWDRRNLADKVLSNFIKKPPFTNQLYHQSRVDRLEKQLQELEADLDARSLAMCQEQYLQAIQRDPQDWWLHWKYAKLLIDSLKEPLAGLEHYRIVTELTPKSYVAHTTYGSTLMEAGKLDAAATSALTALRLNRFCAHAYHTLGMVNTNKGRYDKAMECFSQEIKNRPDQAQGYNQMGILLAQQDKYDKAEEVFRKGLTFSPDNLALHYNFALLLVKQKRYDEALVEVEAALQSNPDVVNLQKLATDLRMATEPTKAN